MKFFGAMLVLAALAAATLVYFNAHDLPAEVPRAVASPLASQASQSDCPQCVLLTEQVAELRRELGAMKLQQAAPQNSTAGKQPLDGEQQKSAESASDPQQVTAARAADAERHHAYVAGVAQAFANEKTDSKWAGYASSRVSSAFEGTEDLRNAAHRVDCRRQTCRIEVSEDGSGNVNRHLPRLALTLVDVLPIVTAERIQRADGQSAMVLYMSAQPQSPARDTAPK